METIGRLYFALVEQVPGALQGRLRLEREELTTRVARALESGSVVMTAGAGYGKSTTIELAIAELGWTAVRVPCDEEVTDAGRLLARLVAAMQTAVPGLADVIADRLALGMGPVDIGATTELLLAEVERLLVDPLIVVIDDGEALAGAPSALALVSSLLGSRSDRLHVAVASRRPLRLRVAKLRATGGLADFGETDLAFSPEECGEYLRERLGRGPDPDELDALIATTRGWPLGVALSARGSVAVAPGAPAGLFEFLGEEVLDRLPEPLRGQVLDSSALAELDGDLLAALDLPSDLPARAREAGLLLEPVGSDGRWRYHPLLREFLLTRVLAERDVADLFTRAATAEKDAGRPGEAVRLLLAAGRHEEAAALIAEVGQALIRTSWRTVSAWLEALPASLRELPPLKLLEGQVLLASGDQPRADVALRAAEAAFEAASIVPGVWAARWFRAASYHEIGHWSPIATMADDFAEEVAAAAGLPAIALGLWGAFGKAARGEIAAAEALAGRALALPEAELLAPIDVGFRGYTQIPAGRIDDVVEFGERVVARLDREDPLGGLPIALASLALMYLEQGRHRESLAYWERTAAAVERLGAARGIAVHAQLGRAMELAQLGRVAEAERALALAEPIPEMGFRETWVHQARAVVAWRRGEAGTAVAECERAYEFLRGERVTADRSWVMLNIIPILFDLGEIDRALAYADETLAFWDEVLPGASGGFWRARTLTERAWLRHSRGEIDAAVEDFASAWPIAAGAERHLISSQWPHVRGVLWSALERGRIDPEAAVAAVRGADAPADDVAAFLEHPLAAVRRIAVVPAAASGHPESVARLEAVAAMNGTPGTPDADVAREAARALDRLRQRPPPLTLTLLGEFAVRRGEWEVEPAAWGRPAAAALVRFLLVHSDTTVPEDDLFEALWPGRPVAKARSSLRVALSRARSVLDLPGAELSRIASVRRTFRIQLGERDHVDALEFAAAAEAARAARGGDRIEALERAAALWTGEPLPEDRYADWALMWRNDLIDRHMEVLGALVRARLQAGDNLGAAAAGRRLVEADPLNEASHVQLMLAYARAGNRSAALRQYLACRGALVEELGVEPSHEVARLHRSLLAGEPL